MREITLTVQDATPERIEPFGRFVGAHAGQKTFTSWPGATVYGEIPIDVARGGEILLVQMDAIIFPLQVGIIERHFHHTQTYLPFNGKSFVMVLGLKTDGDAPKMDALEAFRFDGTCGVVLDKNVWHAFPYALEANTQFAVVLSHESHINTLAEPLHPSEAEGPDLERRSVRARASVTVVL